jgi:hypothetical protein
MLSRTIEATRANSAMTAETTAAAAVRFAARGRLHTRVEALLILSLEAEVVGEEALQLRVSDELVKTLGHSRLAGTEPPGELQEGVAGLARTLQLQQAQAYHSRPLPEIRRRLVLRPAGGATKSLLSENLARFRVRTLGQDDRLLNPREQGWGEIRRGVAAIQGGRQAGSVNYPRLIHANVGGVADIRMLPLVHHAFDIRSPRAG